MSTRRYGMTVPFGAPLADHKELYEELVDLGYTDAWSSEADGTDAFTPLALAVPAQLVVDFDVDWSR